VRLAASIDLSYFFDTAEKRESHRAKLQTVEDLRALEDLTLIDTCARVDLLTDVNRERLRHINYMRNHASAAHPNQSDLTGQEMVAWLSNCLRYAITAKQTRPRGHRHKATSNQNPRYLHPQDRHTGHSKRFREVHTGAH
jgi:hypothetical protein